MIVRCQWTDGLDWTFRLDTSGLKESESVRTSQESVLKALQQYTLLHYPEVPSKFGELLLRIPELERTCQVTNHSLKK